MQQRGFHVGILLAIIAVVAVAGLVIWRVYETNRQTPPTQQQTQRNQEDQTSKTEGTPADPNEGYMVIDQWGVRFKPVDGTDALVYYQPGGAQDQITFTTQAFAEADPNCSPNSGNPNILGALHRSQTPLETYQETYGNINGYYYYYSGPQSTCSSDQSKWDAELQQTKLVKQSLSSLEAAK